MKFKVKTPFDVKLQQHTPETFQENLILAYQNGYRTGLGVASLACLKLAKGRDAEDVSDGGGEDGAEFGRLADECRNCSDAISALIIQKA